MAHETLKQTVSQGLAAMKAGGKVAAAATDEISNDATHPDLKTALQQGNQTSQQWTQRIDRAVQAAGGGGEESNPILEAHYQVSKKIRQSAPDANSRDLGIVAASQLALHYWIAAFGTMAAYTQALGMQQVAQDMHACVEEAKQADEGHNKIASALLQQVT